MKITIESTPELVHANGLPVRVWAGTTEAGNPVMVLVTRVGSVNDAGAAELERELAEPPTRVVDPSGYHVSAPRSCTVCLARDIRRPATHVAHDGDRQEWFECGEHGPTDNLAETTRVGLEPIADWFARHRLPLPGGAYRPASAREPWASIIAGEPPFAVEHAKQLLPATGDPLREASSSRRGDWTIADLQDALDLLLSRYLLDNRGERPSETLVLDLMHWSMTLSGELALDEPTNEVNELVTSVRVERHGAHEGVTLWLRGMQVGTLTVGEGDGQRLRRLLLSEKIVARARELVRLWKSQDGFNATVVDDLSLAVEAVDRLALITREVAS